MRPLALLFALISLGTDLPGQGQDVRYLLDLEGANPGKEIVITRPANGFFPMQLILNLAPPSQPQMQPPPPSQIPAPGPPNQTPANPPAIPPVSPSKPTPEPLAKPVRVTLSQFTGDRTSFEATLLESCTPPTAANKLRQPLDLSVSRIKPICLFIPPIPGEGKFTGSMILAPEDGKPIVKLFSISRPQATLTMHAISPQLALLSRANSPFQFRVVLGEKSGLAPAEGIMVGLTFSKYPAKLDLKNLEFWIAGEKIPNMDSGPPGELHQAMLRTVPAGGQVAVDIKVYGLAAGEYNGVLRFSCPACGSDESLKQTLIIQARDPVWWAVLWLVVSVAVSFIATKVLVAFRRRMVFQRQIRDLTPQWFSTLAPVAAVVWARAVLSQAKLLSDRFWLTSPDLIEAQVNGVKNMLKILDQAHQLHGLLTRALSPLLLRRALIGLDGALSRVDAGAPDDAAIVRIQADLKKFEEWIAKDTALAKFQTELRPVMTALDNEIACGTVPEAVQAKIAELRTALQKTLADPPSTIEAMNQAYENYVRLRVLWDQRGDPAPFLNEADVMEWLRIADERDWNYLKTHKETLRIRIPEGDPIEGLTAFVPLAFLVESSDAKVHRSYIFRQKMEYAWKFTLSQDPGSPGTVYTALSRGPKVVQYFPRGGAVKVAVELRYESDKDSGPQSDLTIHNSDDFKFYKGFERVELISVGIAATAAILTGLSTFYFKGPAFGSFQDYLSLIIWGAGVDQTKNFVANMGAVSPSTAGH